MIKTGRTVVRRSNETETAEMGLVKVMASHLKGLNSISQPVSHSCNPADCQVKVGLECVCVMCGLIVFCRTTGNHQQTSELWNTH